MDLPILRTNWVSDVEITKSRSLVKTVISVQVDIFGGHGCLYLFFLQSLCFSGWIWYFMKIDLIYVTSLSRFDYLRCLLAINKLHFYPRILKVRGV